MVVGVLAVVMIIISAFKFATSAGDSAKLTSAKNTLLYSIIGLVVALASFWIVNTVLDEVGAAKTTTNGTTGGKTVNTPR
jgi:multisubunit Na+/H+ antiporter MnhB subunit